MNDGLFAEGISYVDELCVPCVEDLNSRREKYTSDNLTKKEIPQGCRIFRAVKRLDQKNPNMPDFSCFTDKGLSVFISGDNLPNYDPEVSFQIWRERGYVGLWEVPGDAFTEPDNEVQHDPFPYEDENGVEQQQHPNHAQIFCRKPQSKAKDAAKRGKWVIEPPRNEDAQST